MSSLPPPSRMDHAQAVSLQTVIRSRLIYYAQSGIVAQSEKEAKAMLDQIDHHIDRISRVYDEYKPEGMPASKDLVTFYVDPKYIPDARGGARTSPYKFKGILQEQ